MRNSLKKRLFAHLYSILIISCTFMLVQKKNPRHLGTDLHISVLSPGHFGTDLDISVLGTGQFRTWMRQYSLLTTIVWYLLIVNIFVLVVL